MFRNLLLGLAAALLALLGTIAIASAESDEVDPFERQVSECDGVSLLHRVTEYTPIRTNLPAGAYRVVLWTEDPNYDPGTLAIWGLGQDGTRKRSWDQAWTVLTGPESGFEQYGRFRTALSAPGGMVIYWFRGTQFLSRYILEILEYTGCGQPSAEQLPLSDSARAITQGESGTPEQIEPPSVSDYEPVIISDWSRLESSEFMHFRAQADAFTDRVRTDARMFGPNEDLALDAVCFDNGNAALGFWIRNLTRDENFAESLEVTWRVNSGPVRRNTLTVEYIDTTPTIYFRGQGGFADEWPNVFEGGTLAVRIEYRGVQEDTFDLDLFAETPVHDNLVHCGGY